ncbi:MAG: replicative DNA helicase [Pirellulales bacterium]|nr:replicative DNA helicase [Planctomycetales bacterium]
MAGPHRGTLFSDTRQSGSPEPTQLTDRTIPKCVAEERAVLGSLLLDPELCDEISLILRPDDFFSDTHRAIYTEMLELGNDGIQIDAVLLADRLKKKELLEHIGGVAYLAELANEVPLTAHASYYARLVSDSATLRQLIHSTGEILRDAHDPSYAAREVLGMAEERIFSILERKGVGEAVSFEDTMHEAFERIDARLDKVGISGLETGYADLDMKTGGFQKSELLILAARPSMGKTALAANIAEHVSLESQQATLFVSLEMSRLELCERMLCSFARVNGHKLRNGIISAMDRKRLVQKANKMSAAKLYIDDSPSRTMTEIAAMARRLKRREGLGLIIIDYLQLIEPDNPRDPRQEQVARIARRLKGLARELSIPVLCLAQLNRQTEVSKDNKPRLSHLRESGAIEQDADVVMFVHREEYYQTNDEDRARHEGKAEVIIAKQRNGPTGEVRLAWLAEYARFENLADDVDFTEFEDNF